MTVFHSSTFFRSLTQEFRVSIQPLLLVCEILTMVATKASDKVLFNTYQISSRYMRLASSMDASGKYAEACAALALAARCALLCSPQLPGTTQNEGDVIAERILLFHEATLVDIRSKDSVGLSPIITRLTRTYIEHVKNMKHQSPGECLSSSSGYSLTQALKMTEMEKVIVAATSSFGDNESSKGTRVGTILFSKLLDYAIWNHERPGHDTSASQIAGVVREITRSAIKVVKLNLVDDSDLFLHVTEELNYFLQAQTRRLEILADPDHLQVLLSSLRVTFALQLFDSQLLRLPRQTSWALGETLLEKQEFHILKISSMHLQLAERQFATACMDNQSAQDSCFFAQWAAVQFCQAILSEHLSLAISDYAHNISLAKKIQSVIKNYKSVLCTCR